MHHFAIAFRNGWTLNVRFEDEEALNKWLNAGPIILPPTGMLQGIRITPEQIAGVVDEGEVQEGDSTPDNWAVIELPESN